MQRIPYARRRGGDDPTSARRPGIDHRPTPVSVLATAGVGALGYLLGTRAGQERYEAIMSRGRSAGLRARATARAAFDEAVEAWYGYDEAPRPARRSMGRRGISPSIGAFVVPRVAMGEVSNGTAVPQAAEATREATQGAAENLTPELRST